MFSQLLIKNPFYELQNQQSEPSLSIKLLTSLVLIIGLEMGFDEKIKHLQILAYKQTTKVMSTSYP